MKKISLLLFILSFGVSALAQPKDSIKTPPPTPKDHISTTKQSVKINGTIINLTTQAGTMVLRDEENKPIAEFGFTSYTKEGSDAKRPVMFAYNGGPGSASVPLHIGILGPKRVIIDDPNPNKSAPYEVVNNEYSILDVTDLVMIDPVGTGLSVPAGEAKYDDFWGVDQDIRSISLFIDQFLIANGRLNSPKFLLGESYGTFRNAGIMKYLLEAGITFRGIIMVSSVFDLRSIIFPPNDDTSYFVFLPTYAATAWYHNALENKPENLESYLAEVEEFTQNFYGPALQRGDQLSDEETDKLAEQLSKYTGIKKSIWLKANLRLTNREYLQELMRDKGLTLDRLDSRYLGINRDLLSQRPDYEPLFPALMPPLKVAFLDYLYEDLKVDRNLTYNISARAHKDFKWDWKHTGNLMRGSSIAITTADDLAEAMSQDPTVQVLNMAGYFDNGTPYFGVEYSLNHLQLNKEIKKNIILKHYHTGHMIYLPKDAMPQFKADLADFIKAQLQ